jgi:histone deacetylase HOS3
LDPTLIANASVNISGGGGGQYITNVHLEPYASIEDFHERLYPTYTAQLMGSATSFINKTKAVPTKTLVIVSAGFDASEHEYASMSRHGAKVPTCFFSRFARDVTDFAKVHARGKLLAVLEGGYSQRALCSGSGSFGMFLSTLSDW